MFDLVGKRVLVTGASSGLGATLAEGLAERGAVVGICARRPDRLAEVLERVQAHSPDSRSWTVDLGDIDGLDAFAAQVVDDLGGLDLLVNNAGIPKRRWAWAHRADEVADVLRIDLHSPIALTQALLPALGASGSVVFIGSVAARLGPPAEAVYAAAKAGITAYAEGLRVDLGVAGSPVQVHVVQPGVLATELFELPDNDPSISDIEPMDPGEIVGAVLDALETGAMETFVPAWFKDLPPVKTGDLDGFLQGSVGVHEGGWATWRSRSGRPAAPTAGGSPHDRGPPALAAHPRRGHHGQGGARRRRRGPRRRLDRPHHPGRAHQGRAGRVVARRPGAPPGRGARRARPRAHDGQADRQHRRRGHRPPGGDRGPAADAAHGRVVPGHGRLHPAPRLHRRPARRGITDLTHVQIDPWPAGSFGYAAEEGRRIARCISFLRMDETDNGYARPIEGVIVHADLGTGEVIEVIDHAPPGTDPIPIAPQGSRYDVDHVGPLRTDLRPIHITQPEGVSFTVEDNLVRWQRWEMRMGWDPYEGLTLHQVHYTDAAPDGSERRRSILHRASISEMVVPYGDPGEVQGWKNAFDAGEWGSAA
ncbi:MAG: SDR family NAD(P)-dependent oxidoreductase [Acidimicrobiales bacterium]